MSIGQHMQQMRRMMQVKHLIPNTCINHTCGSKRMYSEEQATLIYAVKPPKVKTGARNGITTSIAKKIVAKIGGSEQAVKKIWIAESHRNASLWALKLPKTTIEQFAEQCNITEPYLTNALKNYK